MRLEEPVRLRARATPTSSSAISRSSATPACGTRQTPSVTTSLRGLVYEEVTVTCADRDLHSGLVRRRRAQSDPRARAHHCGLHDENGRVTHPGLL